MVKLRTTIFLMPTRKGILIDPKMYDELRIKDVRIVTWDDSPLSKHDAYATITIDSIDEYNAEATVAYSCLRNGCGSIV